MSFVSTFNDASIRGWVASSASNEYTRQANIFINSQSIALSSDNTYLAIGAIGNVKIYTGTIQWTLQTTITPTGNVGPLTGGFATDVSLNSDGTYLAVGDPIDDTNKGAVYIFTRSGTSWSQQQKLVPDANSLAFGSSISINNSGNILAIGAIGNPSPPYVENQGLVYIFTRSGTSWTKQAVITPPNPIYQGNFGFKVSFNSDGTVCAISEPSTTGITTGKVYIYTYAGGTWNLTQTLSPSNGSLGDEFGYDISLSADGNFLIVGAPDINTAYIFAWNGTVWFEQKILNAVDTITIGNFGRTVSIDSVGQFVHIGAYTSDPISTSYKGASYIFQRNNDLLTSTATWTQTQRLQGLSGAREFGSEVLISDNSQFAISTSVASPGNQAVYIFVSN
jgi:hypothetical protein